MIEERVTWVWKMPRWMDIDEKTISFRIFRTKTKVGKKRHEKYENNLFSNIYNQNKKLFFLFFFKFYYVKFEPNFIGTSNKTNKRIENLSMKNKLKHQVG